MAELKTYPSRHHSLFQSLVEEVETEIQKDSASFGLDEAPTRRNPNSPANSMATAVIEKSGAGDDPDAEVPFGVGGVIKTCAELSWEILEAKARCDQKTVQAKLNELKFSTCDPKWADSICKYLDYFGPTGDAGDIPYVRYQSMSDFVLPSLAPNAKVALIADWGTGTEEAVGVLRQVAAHEPDVLIHLGDIYYSGTPDEAQRYFLDVVDQVFDRAKKPMPVYSLTGNHDMYSGGAGFYPMVLQQNPAPTYRPDQAQLASYFALRTTDGAWQLLGLDTGLHDHDPFTVDSEVTYLDPAEEAWHLDKISGFKGRTILLSHHQLFSAYENIGPAAGKPAGQEAANPKLYASYQKFAAAGDIAAWFWGHEHNLTVYQPYLGLNKGRCIGHGAIPVFPDQDPYVVKPFPNPPKLVDDPRKPGNPLQLDMHDKSYSHGFVILELDDKTHKATARYYQDTDPKKPMYEEEL